jgi:hypothetical protein
VPSGTAAPRRASASPYDGPVLVFAGSHNPLATGKIQMERVDSLLQELASRHRNDDPRFLAAVRPMVVTILDPATPEHARVPLLELLAETFERDVQVRRDLGRARASWDSFFASLRKLLGL